MKIFWSWQSDTDGDTGRFFVRDCLKAAIDILRLSDEIVDRPEREVREAMVLDQDRKGVVGHPGLADTIFGKIEAAAVFVADVTLVAEVKTTPTDDNLDGIKRLINSNVAIEYGYAVKALTDDAILMVMNLHHGPLTKLPFDLSHKVAPCRYTLAPDASKAQIAAAKKVLTGQFVDALELHIKRVASLTPTPLFQEIQSTTSPAVFWQPGEVLAELRTPSSLGFANHRDDDPVLEYRLDIARLCYLRLIPTAPLPTPLSVATLSRIAEGRRLTLLTHQGIAGRPARNKYGALNFETSGTSTTATAVTQLFRNGEIWAVSQEFAGDLPTGTVVAMEHLRRCLWEALKRFVEIAGQELNIPLPYDIEMGVVGVNGVVLSLPDNMRRWQNDLSEQVYESEVKSRRVLHNAELAAQQTLIIDFIRHFYDLANVTV
jgi:hypothetical protein